MHGPACVDTLPSQPKATTDSLRAGGVKMENQQDIIKNVVEILHDGQKGFSDLAEHMKDPQIKSFFLKESGTRARFASELEGAAGLKREEGGTAGGAVHRM